VTETMIVTGGLGFIGSNFIRRALSSNQNLKITNVDYQGTGSNVSNLRDLRSDKRYRLVKGDLSNYSFTKLVLRKADVVVNFAAQTHVDRSIADAEPFFNSNSKAVFNIVRVARDASLSKIIHISTDEVYGSIDEGSFDESSPLNPSSPYSATKASGDLIINAWNRTYDIGIITLRCTNNFGPWQHPEKLIPKTIIRGLGGMGIPLYGGGKQIRDWIFVEDFCEAIELAIRDGESGETYNISAGNEFSNREVCERLVKNIGNPFAKLVDVGDRPGHDFRYSLNSDKARKHLGWTTSHKFDEALASTVMWYRENEAWWKKVATKKVLSEAPWKERW